MPTCRFAKGTRRFRQDRYALSWRRGEFLRQVRAHVRLVLLALVDHRGQGILLEAAVGPLYASEIGLLREILPPRPVVGDRGYDAVDILERLQKLGAKPAFQMKDTWRYAVRHPLRRASQEEWRRWVKHRYWVEGFFGMMKLKVGAVFPLVREDLAMRRALAVAVLGVSSLFPRRPPSGSPVSGFFEQPQMRE